MDLIIFHASCPDGWAAAYICHMKWPEANFLPLNHGLGEKDLDFVFQVSTGKDVIMVDYSLRTRELNDKLASVAKSFRILDHHKTAQAVLEGASYAIFDMKRSGAGLAWDYLFGKDSGETCEVCDHNMPCVRHSGHRPWWVNYAEDMDLWNWVLPNSQEINAYLMVQPRTVEIWDDLTKRHDVTSATEAGIGVRSYIEYYTRSVVAERQDGILLFEGRNYKVSVLNIPYAGVSEAGSALVNLGYEIGIAWFERGDGITQFSLRSLKGSDVDVSAIAKSYGGGGHASAAGFQLSLSEGRRLVDTILGRNEYVTPRCS
jgi:oligoribonuclease NrnB/cAMP/cGMP phosphodiesterase (DHH superfamily)